MTIGFCGTGLMGTPMIKRMLDAGHKVMVFNRTQTKAQELKSYGAIIAQSPKELADNCTHVFMCLFDWQAVKSVVFGENGLVNGKNLKCVIDHSSLPVDKTIEFAEQLKNTCNANWVDAPISGGVAGAEQGNLAVMAGGNKNDVKTIKEIISCYASRVTHMGDVGTGQTTKLCNQTIVTTTIAAIAEAVSLAQNNGVDASLLNQALMGGWADSTLLQTFVPRMTSTEIPATATINTMLKDLNNINNLADNSKTKMPIANSIKNLYENCSNQGAGEKDVSRLIDFYPSSN